MVGSKIIDWAMGVITKGEVTKATTTWRWAHFRAVMSGTLQLPYTGSNRTGMEKEAIHFSPGVYTMEVKEFCLDNVWGPVHTTWRVTIPPSVLSVYTAIPVSAAHVGRANTRPPIAYILGTHLFVELKCSFCQNPHQGSGWPGHACQPSTNDGPPSKNLRGIHLQPPKRMDLGRPWTSKT